jgi:hypothetical protein
MNNLYKKLSFIIELIKEHRRIILILLLVVALIFIFYWYEWRPIVIRKQCVLSLDDFCQNYTFEIKGCEAKYKTCLIKNGINE